MRSFGVVLCALAMSCGQVAQPPVATPIPVLPLPSAEPPTTTPPTASVAVAPSSSASASSGPPKFVPGEASTLAMPSAVACAFDTKMVTTPIGLHVRAKGGHFANIVSGAARLVIPKEGDAVAEVLRPGAVLRGYVSPAYDHYAAPESVKLYASAPLVLGGIFSVAADAKIVWRGGTPGAIVPIVIEEQLLTKDLDPVPCARFSLDKAKFDAKTLVSKGKFPPRVRLLTADHPIPIATSATDAPIGTLHKSYGYSRVQEIDSASGRSLFVFTTKQGVLFGWIASTDLKPDEKMATGLTGAGVGQGLYGTKGISHPAIYDATCAHDVRIVSDLSEAAATYHGNTPFTYVGMIRAGTSFRYRSTGGALYELWGVSIVLPGVTIARGELSVPVAELIDCSKEKPVID